MPKELTWSDPDDIGNSKPFRWRGIQRFWIGRRDSAAIRSALSHYCHKLG